jgi:hypothetical protein
MPREGAGGIGRPGDGEPFSWRVKSRGAEHLLVELRGEIDENADFSELSQTLYGDVELELATISRINSCGVREWVNFIRNLPRVRSLCFAQCSPPVVMQLNTIYNFRGRARVISFLAPYICEACHIDEYKLLDVAEHFPEPVQPHVPTFRCRRCGGVMMFDELPERYLSFLAEADAPTGES